VVSFGKLNFEEKIKVGRDGVTFVANDSDDG